MACDAASNRLLGNADHPKVIQHSCDALQVRDLKLALVESDPRYPVAMVATYSPEYEFPEDFIKSASPDTIVLLKDNMCARFAGRSQSCDFQVSEIGGHSVLVGDLIERAGPEPLAARLYLVPGDKGVTGLLFQAPSPMPSNVRAMIETIAASLHIDAFAPPPPPDTVSIMAAPGVTVSIPKGWIACDAANNAVLGNTPDPRNLIASQCRESESGELRFFDPRLFHGLNLDISSVLDGPDPDRFAAQLQPAALEASRAKECQDWNTLLTQQGMSPLSCDTAAGTVAGRPAKITTITAWMTIENGSREKGDLTFEDVPYGKGLVRFAWETTQTLKPMVQPVEDAIAASIVIQ
jgi:hypothetical protein